MKPAQVVIQAFGGVRATARAIGRDPSTVSRWKKPKSKKGCGGDVPGLLHKTILRVAQNRGLNITIQDLLYGR